VEHRRRGREPEHVEHLEPECGGDDGAEHHLQHGEVAQIEDRGQLPAAAEAGAFEPEAERDADQAREEVGLRAVEEIEGEEVHGCHSRRTNHAAPNAPANVASMKPQLPASSIAPPLRAWPDVHPPAMRLANPASTPPAAASKSRGATRTPVPRSTTAAVRRAAKADRPPPSRTPSAMNTR